ncbi:MAG: hypothetical protein KAW12_12200 [Candidatus Aminicenantes bacterium]|nr:hypothetical protein [Candidatus Aminicenantes bacterium]
MNKKGVLITIIVLLINIILYSEVRSYEEKTKNRVTTHNFVISTSPSGYSISLSSENKQENTHTDQKFELDTNLSAFSWQYENSEEKTKVTARREANNIFLDGIHKGKQIKKTYKINDLSWNQSFNIGLEKFALSKEKKLKFWAIGTSGSGDMKITKFSVKKKKAETIKIDDKNVEAVHVEISLSGLLSLFWTGHYWYHSVDGKFLRYRGKNKPGASITVMELINVTDTE